MVLLVISALLAGMAITLAYLSRWESVAAAFLALLGIAFSGFAGSPDAKMLIFWGVTAALAVGLALMLPPQVGHSRAGLAYICTGALAGMAVGMAAASSAAIILCTALGIIAGALLMGRMQPGKQLGFPSRQFLNYALAKGFPVLVAYSMAGLALASLFTNH